MNTIAKRLLTLILSAALFVTWGAVASVMAQNSTGDNDAKVKQLLITPEKLHEKLRKNNPAYTGQAQFAQDPVVGLIGDFSSAGITDISALQGIPFGALDLRGQAVSDLEPLSGMPLKLLGLESTKVSNLTPLKGMKIGKLYLNNTPVQDLKPLAGMPLRELMVVGTGVKDLGPLQGAPLEMLWINDTAVTDIAPLANCPLKSLTLHRTQVADLGTLARITGLKRLHIGETPVNDLTPLKGLGLERLIFSPASIRIGLDDIRKMQSLSQLGITLEAMMPPEQFWQLYDKERKK
jgi:internalin A